MILYVIIIFYRKTKSRPIYVCIYFSLLNPLSPGPCPHSGLITTLDCDTNTALVSWTPGSGILYYNASADAFAIAHQQTCSTSGPSCNITNLRCGESYKVSVSGQGQTCPSPAQDWNRITTGNRPPVKEFRCFQQQPVCLKADQ